MLFLTMEHAEFWPVSRIRSVIPEYFHQNSQEIKITLTKYIFQYGGILSPVITALISIDAPARRHISAVFGANHVRLILCYPRQR